MEVPGMHAKQWRSFPGSVVMWVIFISYVFRLWVCQFF